MGRSSGEKPRWHAEKRLRHGRPPRRDWICVSRLGIWVRWRKLDHREPVADSSGCTSPWRSRRMTRRRALTFAGAAILAEARVSRAFGATLAGVDAIKRDRSVDVVTVCPLLAARDAVAGHSGRATKMLKAL
ncbi:hypothetical protein PSEUDO8O_120133 [Pseudomonas sp. 8O]|nr:hypothetical protein PSEUDO8O_120133 [Pseudomonas sp. 8O]